MISIFTLLFLFQLKHFLADYPLQTEYMLEKFKSYPDYFFPLAAHAGVHAAGTLLLSLFFGPLWLAFYLALFDGVAHFAVDRLKASPELLGKYRALTTTEFSTATLQQRRGNKYFWWAVGLDQMLHHLTNYVIIAILIGVG